MATTVDYVARWTLKRRSQYLPDAIEMTPREKRNLRKKILVNQIILSAQCILIFLSACKIYFEYFYSPNWAILRILGLILFLVSYICWVTARFQLGQSFSYTPQASILVRHGFYSICSNPIYIFSTLSFAGYILFIQQYKFLLFLLAIVPIQIYRAKSEALVLREAFGDEYSTYQLQLWV